MSRGACRSNNGFVFVRQESLADLMTCKEVMV
jgi:hypothetical protein